jgi:DNA-binding transcriptional LysR family regulator
LPWLTGFALLGKSTAHLRSQLWAACSRYSLAGSPTAGCCRASPFPGAGRIEVVVHDRRLADFKREDIDLAIRFAPGPGRGLHGEPLCGEELFPVASPALFGGGRTPDTVAALAAYPLLHDIDAHPEQPWMSWRAWLERAGVDAAPAARGMQFTDSIVLIGAAVAGLGLALGRGPHVAPLLARGQLVRVTRESWHAPWSYFLVAPPPHFAACRAGVRRLGTDRST